ncbi:MAG: DNA internalization-related competence protein ComEC/Rec2 [Clostridiales bacterium]|nr:DNA internalization-related competence protein ComEC/Rec2 [Clostridiales bacterium]
MGERIKRPIIWVAFAYIIGILAGVLFRWGLAYFYMGLALLVLGAGLAYMKWRTLSLPLLLILFTLAGAFNSYMNSIPDTVLDDLLGQKIIIRGQVLELTGQSESKQSFIIEAHSLEHYQKKYNLKNRIKTTVYSNFDNKQDIMIKAGDWIEVEGELEKPQGQRNPKGFDYRSYLARRKIHYVLGVPQRKIVSVEPGKFPWPRSWIVHMRGFMADAYDRYIGGTPATLLKAMTLGERWALPSEIKDQFAITGVAHILAISGLHIGFLVLMLLWLTNKLRLKSGMAFIVQGIVLLIYCAMVGGNPSVVRATVMAIVLVGGRAIGRKADSLNSMFLAAFIILIFKPLDLWEVGFQLSFGATAGIILYSKTFSDKFKRLPRNIAGSLATMASAQLGTWPLIAYYFNIFSPVSFAANLILIPIAGIMVTSGLLFPILVSILPILASVMGWWLWWICSLFIWANKWLSGFSWSSLSVVSPNLLFLTVYYIIFFIMSGQRPRWIKKPACISGILAFTLLVSLIIAPIFDNNFKVVFVDVGQGDCIYIRTPDKKHILVDGGGKPPGMGEFDVGKEVVLPFLLKNGVRRLDLVVMSHGHEDHMMGLIPVIKDLKVDAFLEFPPWEPTDGYKELKGLAQRKGVKCLIGKGGDTYRIGRDVFIDIIYPVSDKNLLEGLYENNENNLSLVMNIRYGDINLMLTGDIEKGVESYLSEHWNEEVSVLKVAHHGSKTSSIKEWIKVISPKVAVIQSGKNNFGHPNPDVLERLEEQGAKIFRNDNSGAITFHFKEGRCRIDTVVNE